MNFYVKHSRNSTADLQMRVNFKTNTIEYGSYIFIGRSDAISLETQKDIYNLKQEFINQGFKIKGV